MICQKCFRTVLKESIDADGDECTSCSVCGERTYTMEQLMNKVSKPKREIVCFYDPR